MCVDVQRGCDCQVRHTVSVLLLYVWTYREAVTARCDIPYQYYYYMCGRTERLLLPGETYRISTTVMCVDVQRGCDCQVRHTVSVLLLCVWTYREAVTAR